MSSKNDPLGDRMKKNYEDRSRYFLPRRSFTIIRVDGKCFSQYTKGLERPFDAGLIEDMNGAALAAISHIQGAQFAYIQSDEISILLTDFEKPNTDAWFDGNIQKMASVSASIVTAEFNKSRIVREYTDWNEKMDCFSLNNFSAAKLAYFDARVFSIPDPIEVYNYFLWRTLDCERNSISSVAYANFPHKQLEGKSNAEKQDMLMLGKGINWSKMDESLKNGRFIVRNSFYGENYRDVKGSRFNERWVIKNGWKISQNKAELWERIPKIDRDLNLE